MSSSELEGGDAWEVGRTQFEYLLKQGLQPEHYLLELPCGSFRAGRFLIEYLQASHYYGIDREVKSIKAGEDLVLKPAGLMARHPIIKVKELNPRPTDFAELLGRRFDFIWIHALFDHISPETIVQCLKDLTEVLENGGKMYATIFLNPHGPSFKEPMLRPRNGSLDRAVITFPDREYWHHTIDFFQEIVKTIPELRLDELRYDYPHPLGLRMLLFSRQ